VPQELLTTVDPNAGAGLQSLTAFEALHGSRTAGNVVSVTIFSEVRWNAEMMFEP